MRVYVIGMMVMAIEVGSIVLLLRQGAYALRITSVLLLVSASISWSAAQGFGLPGAALGSVLAIYLDRTLLLHRVARQTGISLRKLQDWPSMFWAAATAAIAGGTAWFFAAHSNSFIRLVVGFVVLMTTYAALNFRTLRR
jgi:hypothetical protein